MAIINTAAAKYGVPPDILAAVLYQESGFNPVARNDNAKSGGLGVDRGIAQINSYYYPHVTDQQADDPNFAIDLLAKETADNFKRQGYGPNLTAGGKDWQSAWLDAAANWHNKDRTSQFWITYRQAIDGNLQAGTTNGRDVNLKPDTTRARDIPGLTQAESDAAHAIADQMYIKYLGKFPNDQEYTDLIRKGWNSDVLEDWLRNQKYGDTKSTIGDSFEIRKAAEQFAQSILGRGPTEGEIAWMIQNGVPTTNVSAFYEQVRDKAVWAVNPEKYRNTRDRVQKILDGFGVQLTPQEIDYKLVNQAATGDMTDDQIRALVGQMQAPGFAVGTTLEQSKALTDVASSYYKAYFPGQTIPQAMLKQLVGMTPDQILAYVRNLPSPDAPQLSVGSYHDARVVAEDALKNLGFFSRTATKDEILKIATTKMDAEGVDAMYRNTPELVAKQPGLPYHLSRENYYKSRDELEKSYGQLFGTTETPGVAEQAAKPEPGAAPAEPEWIKSIFQQGISTDAARNNFATYFRNLGRPPTPKELDTFKSKVDFQYTNSAAGPENRPTEIGPVAPGLGGPSTNKRTNVFGGMS